jgi:tRNA(Arg) A34 adenosine deaminase TadA
MGGTSVSIGDWKMPKLTFAKEYEAGNPVNLKDLDEKDVRLLRRVIEICREAKEAGNYPFGCLLADRDGNILMEQGNCENSNHGDCTCHAETELMRRATRVYTKEEMWELTMYNCGEPCAMCSGAIYWGNLGRLVYIGRESTLKKYTGNDIRNPTLALPCRVIFACGQKPGMELIGPVPELEEEYMKLHEGFWHPTN